MYRCDKDSVLQDAVLREINHKPTSTVAGPVTCSHRDFHCHVNCVKRPWLWRPARGWRILKLSCTKSLSRRSKSRRIFCLQLQEASKVPYEPSPPLQYPSTTRLEVLGDFLYRASSSKLPMDSKLRCSLVCF